MTPHQLKFLFVVPPLAGHVNPTAGIGAELSRRGHAVAWAGSELFLRPLLGPTAMIHRTGSRMLREQGDGGIAAIHSLWDEFVVPYARFTHRSVRRAAEEYRPDALVVDEHTPAGALVACQLGLPWATLATSAMELGRPFADRPEVEGFVQERLRGLWAGAGLPPGDYVDPRSSPHLVLATTVPALLGEGPLPPRCEPIGPVLGDRQPGPAFDWDALDPGRQQVLVTMGTLAGTLAERFLRVAVRTLGALADQVQGVIAAPGGVEGLGPLPDNVLAAPRVPVLDLLRRGTLRAVVCHGGLNSVTEALSHRVPLVLAPIRHDQPITTSRVLAAGAGVGVDFATVRQYQLAGALLKVLEDPGPRAAAARLGGLLAAAGGAPAAADLLQDLATATGRVRGVSDGGESR